MHTLVVGGTGMLAGSTWWLAEQGHVVSVISRGVQQISFGHIDGRLNPFMVDYRDSKSLSQAIAEAISSYGPIDLAVFWIHTDVPDAFQVISNEIARNAEDPWRLFHVRGSGAHLHPEAPQVPPNCLYRQVVLGFVAEEDTSRWLTHDEISGGVIEAIRSDRERSVGEATDVECRQRRQGDEMEQGLNWTEINESGWRYKDAPTRLVQYFRDLVYKYPTTGRAKFELANALDYLGEETQAIPLYEEAISLGLSEEYQAYARLQLGSSLRNVGRFQEAESLLRDAERLYPHMPSISMFLALALHSSGRWNVSLKVALQAMLWHIKTHDVERCRPALENYIQELDDEPSSAMKGFPAVKTCYRLTIE